MAFELDIGCDHACCPGCACQFLAGFTYNGTEPSYWGQDPPSICMLMFTVGNLTDDDCSTINVEDANITIVLKRNGTTITDPLIYDTVNNIILWERWEPTAGDVFTADVTLDCGGGVTYTQSYSFTIPTPANTLCVCCNDRVPDYVTVSGLTSACCLNINGTYALTLRSGESCVYEGGASFSDPGNCSTYCFTCSTGLATFYFSPKTIEVLVGIGKDPITGNATANPDTIVTYVRMVYWIYRFRTIFGVPTCDQWTGTAPNPTCVVGNGGTEWRMESLCNGSAMTITTSPGADAICIGETPAVRIYFQ